MLLSDLSKLEKLITSLLLSITGSGSISLLIFFDLEPVDLNISAALFISISSFIIESALLFNLVISSELST